MLPLRDAGAKAMAALRASHLIQCSSIRPTIDSRAGGASMTDVITLVLGSGGIFLMIAYAVACDRI